MTRTAVAEQPDGMGYLLYKLRQAYGREAVSIDSGGHPRLVVDGEAFILVVEEVYWRLVEAGRPTILMIEDEARSLAADPDVAAIVEEVLKRGRSLHGET